MLLQNDASIDLIKSIHPPSTLIENDRKAAVAKAAGVTFDFLEKEFTPEEESNFQPLNVKGRGKSSWFGDLDGDLTNGSLLSEDADSPRVVNGKLIGREATQGVRVGSAGGWTLEVFPGDFVVHRKYGRSS